MKEACRKFQKSIIFVLKLAMYGAAFATFFLMFSIDNREIIDLSRTAAVTLSTYVIILLLLSRTYGSYAIGMKKDKDIIFSLVVAGIITDLITYFELTIMKTNAANNATFKIENVGILFSVILIQFVIYFVFVKAGNSFYFWLNDAEKCLIVASDENDAKKVSRALLAAATETLAQAKALHDELEAVYHPYVDFAGVDALAEEHIRRLLA